MKLDSFSGKKIIKNRKSSSAKSAHRVEKVEYTYQRLYGFSNVTDATDKRNDHLFANINGK